MSYMFDVCSNLISVPNIDLINTKNVTNMSWMFVGCSSLPDISKLDTKNVTNMSYMFYYC